MNSSDKIDQEGKVYRRESGNVSACLAAKKVSFNDSKWNNFSYLVTMEVWEEHQLLMKEAVGSSEALIEKEVIIWCDREERKN